MISIPRRFLLLHGLKIRFFDFSPLTKRGRAWGAWARVIVSCACVCVRSSQKQMFFLFGVKYKSTPSSHGPFGRATLERGYELAF
jgi:hypothetical protein